MSNGKVEVHLAALQEQQTCRYMHVTATAYLEQVADI